MSFIKVKVLTTVAAGSEIAPASTLVIHATTVIPGEKGEKGDPGDSGSGLSSILTAIAGENISGGKAVVIKSDGKAYVYDINNESNYGALCGVSKTAALTGNEIEIFTGGTVTEVGSGWQAGVVYYVSSTGLLTPTPPLTGILKIMGVGVSTDKILLNGSFEIITI